jgi:hypothetical protein
MYQRVIAVITAQMESPKGENSAQRSGVGGNKYHERKRATESEWQWKRTKKMCSGWINKG